MEGTHVSTKLQSASVLELIGPGGRQFLGFCGQSLWIFFLSCSLPASAGAERCLNPYSACAENLQMKAVAGTSLIGENCSLELRAAANKSMEERGAEEEVEHGSFL